MRSVSVLRKAEDDEVRRVIKPHVSINIGSIEASGASLGFIKPKFVDYQLNIISTEVKDEQMQITQEGLGTRDMIKLKQESTYFFNCQDSSGCSCKNQPHKMEILDWEVNELYRHIVEKTKDPAEITAKMRQKWFDWMKDQRDTYFMMGTHHRWKIWMVVSVLYLRQGDEQQQVKLGQATLTATFPEAN
jgi:hypothetical protein